MVEFRRRVPHSITEPIAEGLGAMAAKTEKVVDPESVDWIEQRKDRSDDEPYFRSAWRKALRQAEARQQRRSQHRPWTRRRSAA